MSPVVVSVVRVFGDARGFFYESYNAEKYKSAGLDLRFVQTNVSRSAHGVLRGLHYQWPNPQGKLVSVLEVQVRFSQDPFNRVELLHRIAALYEESLSDAT